MVVDIWPARTPRWARSWAPLGGRMGSAAEWEALREERDALVHLLVELRKGISSVFSSVVSHKIGERSRARVGRVHRCGMCVVEALVRVSVLCVVSYVSIFFVEISSMTCIQVV